MRQVLAPGGAYHGVKLIVLDSIQGQGLAASATKSYAKVLDFARMCEEHAITTILFFISPTNMPYTSLSVTVTNRSNGYI